MGWTGNEMDRLFEQAGLSPRGSEHVAATRSGQFADTMDSHRLAWYAATVSPEKGERFWKENSRRFLEGKGRIINRGSGNKKEFRKIFQQLHRDCATATA